MGPKNLWEEEEEDDGNFSAIGMRIKSTLHVLIKGLPPLPPLRSGCDGNDEVLDDDGSRCGWLDDGALDNENVVDGDENAGCNGYEETNGYGEEEEEEEEDEIELVVQGKPICVKERLLVKHSRYFAEIFGSIDEEEDTIVLKRGRLEGEEDEGSEAEEEPLANVCYATMRTIVDFMETGVLHVGEGNVRSLLRASDMLAIGSVETACFNYLKATLNPANCVRHFVLADAKRSWNNLSSHCALFIQLNFDSLRKLTQIYQQTTAPQVGGQWNRFLSD